MPTTFVSNSNEQLTVSISEKLIKSVFFVEDPVAEQHLPAAVDAYYVRMRVASSASVVHVR